MLLNTPICDFGWTVDDFTLPDLDGNAVSVASQYGENGLLVAFICNHCPYVKAIIQRLVADAHQLKTHGVNTVAVMPNDFHAYPEDNPENMRKFAATHRFPFPYLLDQSQAMARAYDAVCTPDFFGFNANRELQYRGRLDNAKTEQPQNRQPELLNAMREIAQSGDGPAQQTASMGCSIKWKT